MSPSFSTGKSAPSSGLQSLSLFRILLGLLMLFDFLYNIAPYLDVFYSDRGLVPRAINFEIHGGVGMLSILNTLDHPWHLVLFTVVLTAAIIFFIIGYRTSIMKWVILICYVSIYQRNLMVTYGGDMLIRLFMLWSLFVPLSRYWSVDAALRRTPREVKVPPVLMMGIKSQVSMLYFFSALFKLSGDPWLQGVAPGWAMHDGIHGTLLGMAISDHFPFLMQPMTYGIIAFQLCFPLLVYSPIFNNFTRAIAILGALAMHASFIVLLEVGFFPYICVAYLVLLVPDGWLNGLLARRRARLEKIEIFYEPGCGFCEKTARILREFCLAPNTQVRPAEEDPAALALLRANNSWVVRDSASGKVWLKWEAVAFVLRQNPFTWIFGALTSLPLLKRMFENVYNWIGRSRPWLGKITAKTLPFHDEPYQPSKFSQLLCGLFLVLALAGNIFSVPYMENKDLAPRWLLRTIAMLQLYQRWNLFAPTPVYNLYDYKVSGITVSGAAQELDLPFYAGKITREEHHRLRFQNHHLLKYFLRLYENKYAPVVRFALRRVCQAYNRDPAHSADSLKTATLELWRSTYPEVSGGAELKSVQKTDFQCPEKTPVPVEKKVEPVDPTQG